MKIQDFQKCKEQSKKITMLTCYDYSMASVLKETDIDCLLVGDSVAMVVHGFPNTTHATLEMMELHCQAVHRGAPEKFMIGDMPFMTYRKGSQHALGCMEKLIQAGCSAVKLEGVVEGGLISAASNGGIPIMGHLGLTPQKFHVLGGFRVQGKKPDQAQEIMDQALFLEDSGVFALVLECVPKDLAQRIASRLQIPVIGIGAGVDVDGQVLVLNDLLGMSSGAYPKFVRNYAEGHKWVKQAVEKYVVEVQQRTFPEALESYNGNY